MKRALPSGFLRLLQPPLSLLAPSVRAFSTAPPAGDGGAAKPAAPPSPSKGSSGKKKGGKPAGPKMTQAKIFYGHGAQDRPSRSETRAADRAQRAPAAAGGPSPLHESDPVLAGLLEGASGTLSSPPDLARLVPLMGGLEEPSDVGVVVATHRFGGVPKFSEEFAGRVLAVPTQEDLHGLTDQEDEGGPKAARRAEERREARAALHRARAPGTRLHVPAPLLPYLPQGPQGEARGRAEEMAAQLLADDPALARAQAATAAATAGDSSSSSSSSSFASPHLADEDGQLLPPTEAMGLYDGKLAGVLADLARGQRLAPSAHDLGLEEAAWDEEEGARISGALGGDSVGRIPRGILEEFATPLEFGGNGYRGSASRGSGSSGWAPAQAPSAREAAMSPEERVLNDKRKALRAVIEAPVPVATRPIWPLYSLVVGADTVRLVTAGGVVDSMRCMVVVGNGHGGIGVGLAKHGDAMNATRRALEKAARDMIHLSTHNGCLYHDLLGKKNGVRVLLRANPATGGALKGSPAVVDVLELAGLRSASAKIFGSHRRSPYVVMQALFDAFNHHQSPEQEAAKRGLRLVRHTVDRVNPRTVYPFTSPGPRFPPANHRFVK